MNPLPPNADELVSAYLDGEAAPDEIVVVESNPELMARVDSMRAASGLVGQPVAPPAQKEAHIAAALGAFDEIFAQGATTEAGDPADPPSHLRAVPTAHEAPAAAATVPSDIAAHSDTTVTSFDAAKARRRPRRFNVGVIAAAVAALLLVVAVSALTFGRPSGDDSASTSLEAAASDASSDAVETSADEAMEDEEEAMEEEAAVDTTALSDAGSAAANAAPAPAPTLSARADPQAAADEEDAMDEEAMDDSAADAAEPAAESAMADEEEAMDDQESFGAEPLPFFFGNFASSDELEAEFSTLTDAELDQRKAGVGQGIFARCQAQIPALAAVETATLIGEAGVEGMPRELHLLTNADGSMTVFVVNPQDCSIVRTFG